MGAPSVGGKQDLCPRCCKKVTQEAKRCPGCGERLAGNRHFPIYVGIAGIAMLIFVGMIMLVAIRKEDEANTPGVGTKPAAEVQDRTK
jgi:hypothetical protein